MVLRARYETVQVRILQGEPEPVEYKGNAHERKWARWSKEEETDNLAERS